MRERACNPISCGSIRTLPGDGEYDRKERAEAAREFRYWLMGCALVVLIIVLTYLVYGVLLVHSGWRG